MEGVIYWPVVAAAGATGCFAALGVHLAIYLQQANRPIPLQRGEVRRAGPLVPDAEIPCKSCLGAKKLTCPSCAGMGRTNFKNLIILPKGATPVWCVDCRARGLVTCGRCLGTGVKPKPVGFRM